MIMKWQIRYVASLVASMGMAPGLVLAGVGDLDPAYGAGGRVLTAIPTGALGDGSLIYPLFDSNGNPTQGSTNYAHVDVNGHADPLFGGGGHLSLPVDFLKYPGFGFSPQDSGYYPTALRTPAGQLLLSVVQNGQVSLMRLDATGHLDPSFGTAGFVPMAPNTPGHCDSFVAQLAFQPDGHLLAMLTTFGNEDDIYANGDVAIRRFDGNGSLDTSFSDGAGVAELRSPGLACDLEDDGPVTLNVLQDGSMDLFMPAGRKYFSAQGESSAGPPATTGLPANVPEWRYGGTLPNGDLLLTNGAISPEVQAWPPAGLPSNSVVARVHPDGTPDSTFGGAGTGYVTLDIASLVSSETGVAESVQVSSIGADGQHIYLAVLLIRQCGNSCPSGITLGLAVVRLLAEGTQAGTLDKSFGHNGVALVTKTAGLHITDLIEQPGGALVLMSDSSAMRLLGDNASRSPGLIGAAGDSFEVPPSEATAQVRVSRTLGKDGAVSASYAIGNSPGLVPGSDYTPVSGQLEWADGDFADKIITIPVFHQPPVSGDSSSKLLHVALTAPTGGALLLSGDVLVAIDVAPGSSSSPPPPPTTPSASGGGGSIGPGSIGWLSLCCLLAWRRARRARA
jgi:uncharacterized delta-60 repeat protein